MILTSASFDHDGEIPKIYTCDGKDISPPLVWRNVPEGAKSLALIVYDPDVPDPQAPKRIWVHWVLYNLPPIDGGLPEAVNLKDLPNDTHEGLNDWRRTGYGGPCPPKGRHRYFHRLYALDLVLPDFGQPTKTELEEVMEGHVIATAELIGRYQRIR